MTIDTGKSRASAADDALSAKKDNKELDISAESMSTNRMNTSENHPKLNFTQSTVAKSSQTNISRVAKRYKVKKVAGMLIEE